ncbi:MAG: hypothetical protein ACFFDN_47395 [Candidatus Hodarchaeota archaeon]
MNHKDDIQFREESTRISKRSKSFFIETETSAFDVSFTIKDENNKVILKGESPISSLSKGQGYLLMIGFVGGVFLPFILGIVLSELKFDFLSTEFTDFLGIFLFLLIIPWAIGYTLVYNLIVFRFFGRFTYSFQDENGIPFGELKSNFRMTSWKIMDSNEAIRATLRFPRKGKNVLFMIDTPESRYTAYYNRYLGSGSHEKFKEIEVMDANGVLAFTLLNYGQIVKTEEVLSSLITLLTGTCVIAQRIQIIRQLQSSD